MFVLTVNHPIFHQLRQVASVQPVGKWSLAGKGPCEQMERNPALLGASCSLEAFTHRAALTLEQTDL